MQDDDQDLPPKTTHASDECHGLAREVGRAVPAASAGRTRGPRPSSSSWTAIPKTGSPLGPPFRHVRSISSSFDLVVPSTEAYADEKSGGMWRVKRAAYGTGKFLAMESSR
jgi:hypothetical protein